MTRHFILVLLITSTAALFSYNTNAEKPCTNDTVERRAAFIVRCLNQTTFTNEEDYLSKSATCKFLSEDYYCHHDYPELFGACIKTRNNRCTEWVPVRQATGQYHE